VAKPELVAPGGHVVSLRSPDSVIDSSYPGSRVGDQYFRGSGTSMSAAIGAGAAAGVLAVRPQLRPDDVKALLVSSAYRAAGLSERMAAGAGGLDLAAALAAAPTLDRARRDGPTSDAVPGKPAAWQSLVDAFAAGDREGAHRAWKALDPQARSWAARSWAALSPTARSWAARSWAARSWAGADGTGEEWAARSWAARSWAGDDWAARSWAGDDWAARSWAGDDWAARSWAARSWAGRWE
jgi:serine protease AprX